MQISAVIPAFNVAESISETLASLMQPAVTEIVVVDDGSTDDTARIARATAPDAVHIGQSNRGQGAARNTGARASTAEWILFIDADDVLLPSAASDLVAAATRSAEAACINPRYEISTGGDWAPGPRPRPGLYRRSDLRRVLFKNPFGGNVLMKRAVWQEYPYSEDQDLRYCEDLELWVRLLRGGEILAVPSQIVIRRNEQREGSATSQLRAMRRGRNVLFRRLRGQSGFSSVERVILEYQIVRTSFGIWTLERRSRQIEAELPE